MSAQEALAVIDNVTEELATVPGTVEDARLAMAALRQHFEATEAQLLDLRESNEDLQRQVLQGQAQLDQETSQLREEFEGTIASLQTQIDRLTLLLDEARAEERWIVQRVSESMGLQATNMRDLTEEVEILVEEAKAMVRESL